MLEYGSPLRLANGRLLRAVVAAPWIPAHYVDAGLLVSGGVCQLPPQLAVRSVGRGRIFVTAPGFVANIDNSILICVSVSVVSLSTK